MQILDDMIEVYVYFLNILSTKPTSLPCLTC